MVPAAVGFQCPECVARGRKETRSGRTAYGGQRSGNPAGTSMGLIAVNAAVWLAIVATGWYGSRLVELLALVPRRRCAAEGGGAWLVPDAACAPQGGTLVDGVAAGAPWQLVTSAFTHVDPIHIAFNVMAIWVLGPQVEAALGRWRFLALYFGSGLAGSAMVYWLSEPWQATVGASGAVFGLMAALLVMTLKVRGNPQQILFWIGLNALITVIGSRLISWQGHLGGFLGGLAIMAVLAYAPRSRRTAWQLAGLVVVLGVIVAAIALRTSALT